MSKAGFYLLLSTLLFTALNILVKYLPGVPTSELVLFRGLVSLSICYVFLKRMGISPWGKNKKLLILRGFFGTLSLFCMFYSLQHMPIAMAMTFSNMSPLFTVIIAHFFLKEKVHPLHVVFLLLAFGGVILVKGWDSSVPWSLALIGISTAAFAACAYTSVRALRGSDHAMVAVFYFPLISVPMMIIPVAVDWVPLGIKEIALIVLIGVLTQFAQYFMTRAYQMEKASHVMIYNYAGIVWAVCTGWWLFDEKLKAQQFLGLLVIFLCLVGSSVVTDWQNRRERQLAKA
jgi:drug/metabolite transporter (DMT)-like permease